MNTCEKCSSPVSEEKAFCPNCGAAMTPERQRAPEEELSEEMLPTMYDQPPGSPAALKMTPPVKAEMGAATLPPTKLPPSTTPARPQQKPPTVAGTAPKAAQVNAPKNTPKSAPAANDNRTLSLALTVAAALFVLSIIVVAVLYFMGKI